MSMRRTLIIAATVIVVLGLGVVAYFYFFLSTATITTAPGTTNTGLPVAGPATGAGEDGGTVETSGVPSPGSPVPVTSRLVMISAGPVVPGEVVTNRAGTASTSAEAVVHYIERQSGNVFTYSTLTETTSRVSNKTLPGIQSASWLPNASVAFVRYLSGADLSTINTYSLSSSGAGGFFLPQNLADLAVSSTSLLTLASGVNGSTLSTVRIDGTRSSEIFTTPLSSVRISFAGKNKYLLYTKPSSSLAGSAFLIDGVRNSSRIAGPLDGLVALASPLGKWVLISYSLANAMQMKLVSVATGDSFQLPVATIADKCVWASDDSSLYCGIPTNASSLNQYPDDWYQGVVHFSDRIWKVDVVGRFAQLVLDFSKEATGELDAHALAIDTAHTTIVFINKNDGSLWSYSL